jgi:hypothetical protein
MKLFPLFPLAVTCFGETHRFQPTDYYNTFSSAHKPALRIKPGDRLITSTIEPRLHHGAG